MPRIEAQPESLRGASGSTGQVAAKLEELHGLVSVAAGDLTAAVGTPDAAAAIAVALEGWGAALTSLAGSVSGVGSNLAGAASTYAQTDEAAMPASTTRR